MPEQPKAKRMRFAGKIVTLEVTTAGAASTSFSVHGPIMSADSDFFRVALDQKWKEGQDLLVRLPEDPVDTVAAYVEWLYSGEVTFDLSIPLASMCVFAEKIQSSRCCNAVISKMLSIYNNLDTPMMSAPRIPAVNIIFDGTSTNSPARQFMVDIWKANGVASSLSSSVWPITPHPDFVMGLATAALRKDPGGPRQDMCEDQAWFKKT